MWRTRRRVVVLVSLSLRDDSREAYVPRGHYNTRFLRQRSRTRVSVRFPPPISPESGNHSNMFSLAHRGTQRTIVGATGKALATPTTINKRLQAGRTPTGLTSKNRAKAHRAIYPYLAYRSPPGHPHSKGQTHCQTLKRGGQQCCRA